MRQILQFLHKQGTPPIEYVPKINDYRGKTPKIVPMYVFFPQLQLYLNSSSGGGHVRLVLENPGMESVTALDNHGSATTLLDASDSLSEVPAPVLAITRTLLVKMGGREDFDCAEEDEEEEESSLSTQKKVCKERSQFFPLYFWFTTYVRP